MTYFRYYVGTDWQAKKLDVEVEVPLTLDLESLRSTGMQVRCEVCGVRCDGCTGNKRHTAM